MKCHYATGLAYIWLEKMKTKGWDRCRNHQWHDIFTGRFSVTCTHKPWATGTEINIWWKEDECGWREVMSIGCQDIKWVDWCMSSCLTTLWRRDCFGEQRLKEKSIFQASTVKINLYISSLISDLKGEVSWPQEIESGSSWNKWKSEEAEEGKLIIRKLHPHFPLWSWRPNRKVPVALLSMEPMPVTLCGYREPLGDYKLQIPAWMQI